MAVCGVCPCKSARLARGTALHQQDLLAPCSFPGCVWPTALPANCMALPWTSRCSLPPAPLRATCAGCLFPLAPHVHLRSASLQCLRLHECQIYTWLPCTSRSSLHPTDHQRFLQHPKDHTPGRAHQKGIADRLGQSPMAQKLIFEAVSRTLRDVMADVDPALGGVHFGGIPVVLGGDFRQVLPVIKRDGRAAMVEAMLRKSSLWPSIQQLKLTINERVRRLQGQDQQQQAAFAGYLLQVGEGRDPHSLTSARMLSG